MKTKRFLAVLLSVLMLVSGLSFTVNAGDITTATGSLLNITDFGKAVMSGFAYDKGGDFLYADTAGSTFAFSFTGTNAAIVVEKGAAGGKYELYIDKNATAAKTIDLAGSGQTTVPVSDTDLSDTEHKVLVVFRANGENTGNKIVDFAVTGEAPAVKIIDVADALPEGLTDVRTVYTKPIKLQINASNYLTQYSGRTIVTKNQTFDGQSSLVKVVPVDAAQNVAVYFDARGFYEVVDEITYRPYTYTHKYMTIEMYVDDPEGKTEGAGLYQAATFYNVTRTYKDFITSPSGSVYANNPSKFTGEDVLPTIVPNTWQRIVVDMTKADSDRVANAEGGILYTGSTNGSINLFAGMTGDQLQGVTAYIKEIAFYSEKHEGNAESRITGITVAGEKVKNFSYQTEAYDVEIPYDATLNDLREGGKYAISATTTSEENEVEVVLPSALELGKIAVATVNLKDETGSTIKTFILNLKIKDDVTINGVKFGAGEDDKIDIAAGQTTAVIILPAGTKTAPEITPVFVGNPEKIKVIQAASLQNAAVIQLDNDGDNNFETALTVTFQVTPSAITGIKLGTEDIENFATGTDSYNIVLPYGSTPDVLASGGEFEVSAQANVNNDIDIVLPTTLPGAATVTLKGENASDADIETVTLNFTLYNGAKLKGFKYTDFDGEDEVSLTEGQTSASISLVSGTKDSHLTITPVFEGNPEKVKVAEDFSIAGGARILTDEDGDGIFETTLTITFSVLPSYFDTYPEADRVVYVSNSGSGDMTGSSKANAYPGILEAIKEFSQNAGETTVFVLLEDYEYTTGAFENGPGNIIITGIEGVSFAIMVNLNFKQDMGSEITFDNIELVNYHPSNGSGDRYISAKGNSLSFGENVTVKNQTGNGAARTAGIMLVAGGDGGTYSFSKPAVITALSGNLLEFCSSAYGGSAITGDVIFNIGGSAQAKSVYPAGRFSNAQNSTEALRTVNGNATVNVYGNAVVDSLQSGASGVITGDYHINIGENAHVKALIINGYTPFMSGSTYLKDGGHIKGDVIITVTGGKIDAITISNTYADLDNEIPSAGKHQVLIVATDKVTNPIPTPAASGKGFDYRVNYSGNGTVDVEYDENGKGWLILKSTEKYVTVNGQGYYMDGTGTAPKTQVQASADGEKTLKLELPENQENLSTVAFTAGTAANFVYYPRMNDTETTTHKVLYGFAGEGIVPPSDAPSRENWAFGGWYDIEDATKTVLTDFGTYADTPRTFVASFVEGETVKVTIKDENGGSVTTDEYIGTEITLGNFADKTDNSGNITQYFLGWATSSSAKKPEYKGGDKVTVGEYNVTYYPVYKDVTDEKFAQYIFEGRYDYSDNTYTIDMYYDGPEAILLSFGISYNKELFGNLEVEYSNLVTSSGTMHFDITGQHPEGSQVGYVGDGFYADDLHAKDGAVIIGKDAGGNLVPIVSFKAEGFSREDYLALNPEQDFGKYIIDKSIKAKYDSIADEYLYIADEGIDPEDSEYFVFFKGLEDNKAVSVTAEGVDSSYVNVTYTADATMLEDYTFNVEKLSTGTSVFITYFVDGASIEGNELVPDAQGDCTIPAEKMVGDITIKFSYGDSIVAELEISDIDVPVAGETPDTDATVVVGDAVIVPGGVTWNPADQTFKFGTAYTVSVKISANNGSILTSETVYKIVGEVVSADAITYNPDGTVNVSYTYQSTVPELGTAKVTANLVRGEQDKAIVNFGKVVFTYKSGAYENTVTPTEVVAEDANTVGASFTAQAQLLAGVYEVSVIKNGYLTGFGEVTVSYNNESSVSLDLVPGNIVLDSETDDGVIDYKDAEKLLKAFTDYTGSDAPQDIEQYRALVDVDEDGIVTIFDLNYIKSNYGKTEDAGLNP